MSEQIQNLKNNIIAIGRLLWEKDLVSGLNGNISVRVENDTILLTGHGSCLGLLQEKDILLMKLDGQMLEEGSVSTEKLLHTSIYKSFSKAKAVLHTHTTYTNAYFLENNELNPRIFESKMQLGQVKAVPQHTPAVTDAGPVMEAFKQNNIVVLKNHGVVAMGAELFDCFLLIQALEDAVKVDAISKLYSKKAKAETSVSHEISQAKKYKLFSKEQIDEIVRLVNADRQLNEMGTKTSMTMDLAVHMDETKQTYAFRFENGRITNVSNDPNVEFFINAPENVWRAVFNREIDPFVATTQKKMHLKGDFAKISKWYAPCSRLFELWSQVPVE
jgi:ribulose-5-phosphate 4-epimerase/fuculose-1-phosphate aldolase